MEPPMDADERRCRIDEVSRAVIGAAYEVSNSLGVGFLEKVYENALAYELRKKGFGVQQQTPICVTYDGVVVGEYLADLLVEGLVLVELKVVKAFDDVHMAQCLNYLKASSIPLCLLLNFGSARVDVKRIVNNY
jgi:GxxExxY protein